MDSDTKKKFMASREVMHWNPMRDGRGYCVMGILDSYDPDDPDCDDWEPWIIDQALLHCLIVKYYKKHPNSELTVVANSDGTAGGDSSTDDEE